MVNVNRKVNFTIPQSMQVDVFAIGCPSAVTLQMVPSETIQRYKTWTILNLSKKTWMVC